MNYPVLTLVALAVIVPALWRVFARLAPSPQEDHRDS